MELIATLRPWGFVLLAIWLLIWGIRALFIRSGGTPLNFVEGLLGIIAIVAGVLMLISS